MLFLTRSFTLCFLFIALAANAQTFDYQTTFAEGQFGYANQPSNADPSSYVDPYNIVQAEGFHEQSGTQIVGSGNASGLAYIHDGDFIRFDNVDFWNGPISGGILASSNTSGGTIEFRTGSTDGELIATANIINTGGWTQLQVFPIDVVNSHGYADGSVYLGTQTLYMVFTGANGLLMALDKFRFNGAQVPMEVIVLDGCPTTAVFQGDLVDFGWQVTPNFPSVPVTVFSVDNGDFIDPIIGEFVAQTPGEVTVTISSLANPEVFDQCTFTVIDPEDFRVLIFHETNGFRHGSINAGIDMIEDFGSDNDWTVENSQDSDIFNAANLSDVDVVVWLNTSGNNLLNASERAAFEDYIENGGGFVGFHAATDTYRDGSWPWYNDLVGAIVQTGPNHTSNNFNATMDVVGSHLAIDHLGTEWNKNEEYYYWELNGGYIFDGNIDLLRVRSTGSQSYDAPRPITWYKEYDGGRSFYTALGHNGSDYSGNQDFRIMSEEAIRWAGGLIDITPENGLAEETEGGHTAHDHALSAYPNPVDDILVLSKNINGVEIVIYNLSGQLVFHSNMNRDDTGTINLEQLGEGFYLLMVLDQNGEPIHRQKLVVN